MIMQLTLAALTLWAGYQLMNTIGLVDSPRERKEEKEEEEAPYLYSRSDGFDPTFWQRVQASPPKTAAKFPALSAAQAQTYATTLMSARGTFSDDEDAVRGVFASLKSLRQLSQVAYIYQQFVVKVRPFGVSWPPDSLLAFLQSFLNNSEMMDLVFKYVEKYPAW